VSLSDKRKMRRLVTQDKICDVFLHWKGLVFKFAMFATSQRCSPVDISNARPEFNMCEGWLIQEGLVFISQYLHEADSSLPHPFSISHFASMLEVKDRDGPTIVPQGQGRSVSSARELRSKLNTFSTLNTAVIRPWVDRH
jgi:hypothetical protein